ncbi:MAG: LrgB family protein [Pseudoflavonifractor sp.]|nr:LrgB family protein [Alloprevotella sp.]MCM1116831.1 LrgB family protein [Pseudoflavonifractor sp.]
MSPDSFLCNAIALIAITFGAYIGASALQRHTGLRLLNPVLVSVTMLILFLSYTDIDYTTYREAGRMIEFWLKPAVVALGVPLYRQLSAIKKQMVPLLVSEIVGSIIGVVSVVLIAKGLGASQEVILSLAPKAVTTPIAMEISKSVGGLPALTAAVVVATGILGSVAGFKMAGMSRIKSPIAQGLSVGTASHAVGTAAAMERGERYGAFSSLGLILNGLLTALLTPFILPLLGL